MDERIFFKTETASKLLQEHFTDEKTKLSNDSAKLMAEFLRVFVAEGAARAGHQAKTESAITVEIEHLEKILPQLLLDF
ncbi:centromere protein X-like [Dendronephthya gigantea]|uniref:centromere protein X-like n=1 Tax=Dendronephthya gigantea TaxID=151771 RepID=UPI00106BC230|nr:centromere protein X-like [Dendronephthya gigantea]